MISKYCQAVEKAMRAVIFFAIGGYHVTSAFGRHRSSVEVTVYFYESDERIMIEEFMTRYKDENDAIVFDKSTTEGLRKFYTLTLIKHLS